MQEIKTTSTLYIPDNIKTGFEAMSGFGWKEIAKTIAVVGVAFVVAVIWHFATGQEHIFHGIGIVVISGGVAFVFFRKDENNQSMLDNIRRFARFSREQQKYKYRYHDPYASQLKGKS